MRHPAALDPGTNQHILISVHMMYDRPLRGACAGGERIQGMVSDFTAAWSATLQLRNAIVNSSRSGFPIRPPVGLNTWGTSRTHSVPTMFRRLLSGAVLVFVVSVATGDETPISFERDVRPIFKAACFHCHGEAGKKEGQLDVRLSRFLRTGGESGPAIVPGDAEASYLYQRVFSGEMPPEESHTLSDREIASIRRWINSGAETLRPEPESINGELITAEERAHWAYQPISRPDVPDVEHGHLVRNPIDRFILAQLEEQGVTFAKEADPAVMIRRVCFDLLGLPPTPKEVDAFVAENAPDAYERLVDRSLASPHYGERWGRHWLDVAGYADSEGYSIHDSVREHAWRYRDYVIRAFNDGKPFDRFIFEQLAGDELISTPLNNLSPEDAERLAATGFLRMAPDGTGGTVDDVNLARNDVLAETIKIVSTSLLGTTVGCAQCHDHRYDPIPQTDYYRMRAIFEPGLDWQHWRSPKERLISLYTDDDRAQAAEIESDAKAVEAERTVQQTEFIADTFEKELAKLPEEIQADARIAKETPEKERTTEQKSLLKKYPSLNVSAGSLYLYDKKAADALQALADKAQAIRATKPTEEFVRALTEVPGQVPVTRLFARGDHEQPQQELAPAGLTVLTLNADLPEISPQSFETKSTGRRTAFANRLTDSRHPLTARVIVNRIWLHHFGRGLVATPGDFGALGSPPTHPELLDWLASEFMDSGWSVKRLHRLIMTSATYRQASRTNPDLIASDRGNLLYGGANLRRVDAEVLRDAVLAVSGKLNDALHGKPVPVMADRVGRWVLGIENLNAGRPGEVIPLDGAEARRSVYVQARRSRPLAVLDAFDWPRMSPNCDRRRPSTVAPQSLMLMNSDFALESSRSFATRVIQECDPDTPARIERAWQLAYGRAPSQSEFASARLFLEEQTALLHGRIADDSKLPEPQLTPESEALASLCQLLLSSNEFLYVE